ncbi:MAG TPA: hypothetical protein ENI76_10930 [Ignavibacteria bacterium]|nr:hypothetical protein [Ignavibacteria bacterium]
MMNLSIEKMLEDSDLKYAAKHRMESGVGFMGIFTLDHYREGELIHTQSGENIVVTEGLNHLLDVVLGGVAANDPWYVGIFKGNYTPIATNTAANALGSLGLFTECQDADYATPATNRPAYIDAAASGGVMTNTASKAAYTMSATITVYGAFLASSQAKTATTGVLFCAKKFAASRAVISADVLNVTYQLTATSS